MKQAGIFLLVVLLLGACSSKEQADLLIHHAKIYTVDSSFSIAEAVVIKDGKFLAVGSNDEILRHYTATQVIDAQGKTILPGLIDAHCHFYGYGKGLQELNLVGTTSFQDVTNKLVAFSKEHPNGWLIGRGWDQNDWATKEFPNNQILDSLFPDRPVFLERIDGHAALANSYALKAAAIDAQTSIKGGIIERANSKKSSGYQLTGMLIDNAVDLLKKAIPAPSENEINAALLAAQKNCFAAGLTTVDDAGLDKNIVEAIRKLQAAGELKIRIYAMLSDNKENYDRYLQGGPFETGRLHVCSFKFYADGALGSRGACLLQPYSDKPEQQGFLLNTIAHFDSAATLMQAHGFQMNTHCIGDSAVRMISNVYLNHLVSKSTASPAPLSYRWRIEHAQVVEKQDLPKFRGIIPSVQPTHATSDMYWAEDRLGATRVKCAYAYNELLNQTGLLALGTDFPVEDINPFYTFYAAVTRKDLKGFPENGFQMENALSKENSLKGMTIWAAFANFEEKEKGSIVPGKYADLVMIDRNIMECDLSEIPQTKVVYTIVNGEIVAEQK